MVRLFMARKRGMLHNEKCWTMRLLGDLHGRRLSKGNQRVNSCGFSDLWAYKYPVCGQSALPVSTNSSSTSQEKEKEKQNKNQVNTFCCVEFRDGDIQGRNMRKVYDVYLVSLCLLQVNF